MATVNSSAVPALEATGLKDLGVRLLEALRRNRRLVSLGAYAGATALGYAAAIWIAFDLGWPDASGAAVLDPLLVLVGIRVITAGMWGLARPRWRYVGPSEIRKLVLAVGTGSLLFIPMVGALGLMPQVPAAVLILEPTFTVLLMAGGWLGYRSAFEVMTRHTGRSRETRKVLIVGAGEAGEFLARAMLRQPNGYEPVAFVDDDPERHGTSIRGVRVVGSTAGLRGIAQFTKADEIVIAIPSAEPEALRRIVDRCEPTGLPFRVLPHVAQVLDGEVSLKQLRDLRIEDLLGRDPVDLELPELKRDLSGKVVLITGAAGSIGSELARQVARNGPRRIVLLDQSETGLFYTEMELKEDVPELDVVAVVADVVDGASMDRVFSLHAPDRVFHAAAYKHVPMMEANPREALQNNIVGTWRVADAAGRHGAEKFVLVSTDKAVRPANIMGATKRIAEFVILELQDEHPDTAFGAVRFGNVLGSAGSVIPIFKRQLEAGKPLTVTHPEVTRYFMTIPEAAQLVLQASLLPELRGRIAMLDMGKPVRILDLARSLLRLSGGGRGEEPIVFTGLRPGEKLHEELVAPEEDVSETRIEKVNVLCPNGGARHGLVQRMGEWDRLLAEWKPDPVMAQILEILPELREQAAEEIGAVPLPEKTVDDAVVAEELDDEPAPARSGNGRTAPADRPVPARLRRRLPKAPRDAAAVPGGH